MQSILDSSKHLTYTAELKSPLHFSTLVYSLIVTKCPARFQFGVLIRCIVSVTPIFCLMFSFLTECTRLNSSIVLSILRCAILRLLGDVVVRVFATCVQTDRMNCTKTFLLAVGVLSLLKACLNILYAAHLRLILLCSLHI